MTKFSGDSSTLTVEDAFDSEGLLDFSLGGVSESFDGMGSFDRDAVVALRDHLSAVLRASEQHQWGTAWSNRKRHVVDQASDTKGSAGQGYNWQKALCSEYTYVYFGGATRNNSREFPALNSDEVMSKPACKLCEKKVNA